jgi:hypothetical protein
MPVPFCGGCTCGAIRYECAADPPYKKVISLPTEKLMALRRELRNRGQSSILQADADLSVPTTLLV